MIKVEARLTGDLLAGLQKLQEQCGEQVLRAGGFAGAALIRDQAIRNAPEITGVLKRNLIVKRREEASDGGRVQRYLVAIRQGKRGKEGDAYYGRWVEQGHKIVGRKAKGGGTWKAHRALAAREYGSRTVPARPFLRPAWESLKRPMIAVMLARMRDKMLELQQQGGPR
jgi:hypothetical protein